MTTEMTLEVLDTDIAVTTLPRKELITGLLDGRFGLFTQVRLPGEEKWDLCSRTAPFAYLMPRFVPKRNGFSDLDGTSYLCSDLRKLMDKTKEVIDSRQLKNGGFFIPMWYRGLNVDMMVKSKMFALGRGIFAVPFLTPIKVKPGSPMSLRMLYFNLTKEVVECDLSIVCSTFMAGDAINISEEDKAKMKFAIYPGKNLTNVIQIQVSQKAKPKEYTLKVLGKTSASKKIASGLATAAITAGLSVLLGGLAVGYSYPQGQGFSVKFNVFDA
jgi:hypothetical protein